MKKEMEFEGSSSMDNVKIGKLIAELRRKKGLTQQDLGDMVGVGFKAVSKWECGTTLPDITIINEVSKILGITTDELLNGELNVEEPVEETKEKKKIPTKLVVTISIITVLLIFITTIFTYQNNKIYSYNLTAVEHDEYFVEGKAYLKNDKISVSIDKLNFKNEEFLKTIIENYEYSITIDNEPIFGYGYLDSMNVLEHPINIEEFSNIFTVNFDTNTKLSNEKITKNTIEINLKLLDQNKNEIVKIISVLFENEVTK